MKQYIDWWRWINYQSFMLVCRLFVVSLYLLLHAFCLFFFILFVHFPPFCLVLSSVDNTVITRNLLRREHTNLIERNTSPVALIRMNVLGVVAIWNCADFSLAKNVSGTQIFSETSAPTNNASIPGLGLNDNRESRHAWRK